MHKSYGGAQGRRRRGERAQTTRIASFGPYVRVFFFFYRFFFLLIHIYRYYGCYGATEGCAGFYEEKNGVVATTCVIYSRQTPARRFVSSPENL